MPPIPGEAITDLDNSIILWTMYTATKHKTVTMVVVSVSRWSQNVLTSRLGLVHLPLVSTVQDQLSAIGKLCKHIVRFEKCLED